jgi:hypothetical protein
MTSWPPSRLEVLDAPADDELEAMRRALADRLTAAEHDVSLRPPPARPTPEACRYCPVKHMCEEYWTSLPRLPPPSSSGGKTVYVDCQGVVSRRNGPRSIVLQGSHLGGDVLLRTATESPPFSVADHVRLVGVAYSVDDDAQQRITTITQNAEVFVLAD